MVPINKCANCVTFSFLVFLSLAFAGGETKPLEKFIYFDSVLRTVYLEDYSGSSQHNESSAGVYAGDIHFHNQINGSGWAFLEINVVGSLSDEEKAFAGGYAEGKKTASLIHAHWYNVMKGLCRGGFPCKKIKRYLKSNEEWIIQMTKANKHDPYWRQVSLFYAQLDGLSKGYLDGAKEKGLLPLGWTDLYLLNIQGDLEDLGEAFRNNSNEDSPRTPSTRLIGPSCSALVKILPNNSDIFVAHDTWTGYNSMLRIMKKYTFPYHLDDESSEIIPGEEISFSSYPGVIHSGDDIYTTAPARLTTLETTIGNSDRSNWKYLNPNGQVLESVRAMVANRLAVDSKSWATIFKNFSSGTYNNQWMIIDWNKFTPGLSPTPGFLRILEQIPGLVVDKDLTELLIRQTYWPSYNVPFFKSVFNQAGNQKLVDEFGDWFSYDLTARALIFKRDHSKVQDLSSMLNLMQYNDFQRDSLSKCNCTPPYSAENAISARNDLNPANGTYPFSALGHRQHGGTDTKITSHHLSQMLTYYAKSGPSTGSSLPTFCWSTSGFSTPHLLHPDCWNFDPLIYRWRRIKKNSSVFV